MSPGPQHGTPAGDAILAIRSFARQSGADVQELMTLYALEGLLARIALSEYREDFVLKGGVLLAAFAARRPTKDIDRSRGVFERSRRWGAPTASSSTPPPSPRRRSATKTSTRACE